jgi:hypothetical protein
VWAASLRSPVWRHIYGQGMGHNNILGGTVELPHTMVGLGRWKVVKVDGACWHILTSALGASSPPVHIEY